MRSTAANYPPSEWLDREGWTVPTLVDDTGNTAGRAFGLTLFPMTVFVDSSGTVLGRVGGGIPIGDLVSLTEQIG